MMRNKKGWLRIVEAFIAVLIVASVLLVVITRVPEPDKSEEIHDMQRTILRQVASNDTLRGEILNNDGTSTKSFIESIIEDKWGLDIKICEIQEICKIDYIEKDVYVDETLISSNLTNFQPKKLKLFIWEK